MARKVQRTASEELDNLLVGLATAQDPAIRQWAGSMITGDIRETGRYEEDRLGRSLRKAMETEDDPDLRAWIGKLLDGAEIEKRVFEEKRLVAEREEMKREQERLLHEQAERDQAYQDELTKQKKAAPRHKAKLKVALETLMEKVDGSTAPANGTKPTGDTDDS